MIFAAAAPTATTDTVSSTSASTKTKPTAVPLAIGDKQMSKVVPFNDADPHEEDGNPVPKVASMASLVSENPEDIAGEKEKDQTSAGELSPTPTQGLLDGEEKREEDEHALAVAGAAAIAKDQAARELPCEREDRQAMKR
jgi:hypothetical protein